MLIQIIPKVFTGIQNKAFGRTVIKNAMLFALRKFAVSLAVLLCGSIMLKISDIDIILKQWDNVLRKNFISVALGIHFLFNDDKIGAKAMCDGRPDQDRTPKPKTIKYATVSITLISAMIYSNPVMSSMNGKPRLVRQRTQLHCCLSQRWCVHAQLIRFTQ